MKAMAIARIKEIRSGEEPLEALELSIPRPKAGELLLKVEACGVCHTELDEIEGRTPPASLPMVPGHQVVGRVSALGAGTTSFREGDRAGVGWIYSACGLCSFCRSGRENLCASFRATGRDEPGGYAEYMTVPQASAFPIPPAYSAAEAAPLLCAGAVGYRSLRLAGVPEGGSLGFSGFGASAHLVLKLSRALHPSTRTFVFARAEEQRGFALSLGADWSGGYGEDPGEKLDAVIDTTPAWNPVVAVLRHLKPGGRLIINAIRKEAGDSQALVRIDYARDLWMEKEVKSVANVTRADLRELLMHAGRVPLVPEVTVYPLIEANRALRDLKTGGGRGARVLAVD